MTTRVQEQFDDAQGVTPSDTTELKYVRGLYIGGAGNVAVTTDSGNVVTFSSVTAGTILKIGVKKVMATNTTATNIVALI